MNRAVRYVIALSIAGAITGVVGFIDPAPGLLFGIFVIYAVTTEIVGRYPELVWGHNTPSVPSGIFAGGATFSGTMLAQGFGPDFGFAAAMFGLGIASFGLSTGYWLADNSEPAPSST